MNKQRRRRLFKIGQALAEQKSALETILEEEDEMRDNLPENLGESNMYMTSEESSDKMNNALENLEEAINSINEI